MSDDASLRQLAEAASYRPWSVDNPPEAERLRLDVWWARRLRMADGSTIGWSGEHDASLIVAAVNSLEALLDERDRLREALALAQSMILSGERMTWEAQRQITTALRGEPVA